MDKPFVIVRPASTANYIMPQGVLPPILNYYKGSHKWPWWGNEEQALHWDTEEKAKVCLERLLKDSFVSSSDVRIINLDEEAIMNRSW